jgi:hypothetical protein
VAIRSASARSASTPWDRLPSRSCPTLVRQDPNAIRSRFPGLSVASTLAGSSAPSPSAGGQTRAPSTSTPYGVTEPGSSPSATTSA